MASWKRHLYSTSSSQSPARPLMQDAHLISDLDDILEASSIGIVQLG